MIFLIEVYLIYGVGLVCAVQQRLSLGIYTFLFMFLFRYSFIRTLHIVRCAARWDPVFCPSLHVVVLHLLSPDTRVFPVRKV